MATPPNTPTMGNAPQGPAGGGRRGFPALASPGSPQDQAAALGDQNPFSPGVALRAHEIWSCFGVRAQGGDFRLWEPVRDGPGDQEGPGGLGADQVPGGGGEVLGDRAGGDDEVRRLWSLDLTLEASEEWDALHPIF